MSEMTDEHLGNADSAAETVKRQTSIINEMKKAGFQLDAAQVKSPSTREMSESIHAEMQGILHPGDTSGVNWQEEPLYLAIGTEQQSIMVSRTVIKPDHKRVSELMKSRAGEKSTLFDEIKVFSSQLGEENPQPIFLAGVANTSRSGERGMYKKMLLARLGMIAVDAMSRDEPRVIASTARTENKLPGLSSADLLETRLRNYIPEERIKRAGLVDRSTPTELIIGIVPSEELPDFISAVKEDFNKSI